MRVVEEVNPDDLPDNAKMALDALSASMVDPSSVYYCHYCDGLRRRDHDCPHPNLTLEEGLRYAMTGELPNTTNPRTP